MADAPKIEVSPKLENWMRNEVQARCKRVRIKQIIRAILIAAIITALLAVSAMAVPAIREAVIRFFLEEYSEHYSITFDAEQAATAPSEIKTVYKITYVPEGFEPIAESITSVTNVAIWVSQDGGYIHYVQGVMPSNVTEDNWAGFDHAGEPTAVIVGEYAMQVIPGDENNIWVWTNNSYIFSLELPKEMTEEEETMAILKSWKAAE